MKIKLKLLHDILVLTITFEVPNWVNAKWIHVTNKMPTLTNGYRRPEKIRNFFNSRNQQMPIRISDKVPQFVLNDCQSYQNWIWRQVLSVRLMHRDSRSKWGENGIHQFFNLISCISMFLLQKVSVILAATSNFLIKSMK